MEEAKRRDLVKLNLGTPMDDISRLTVQKHETDVLRYCSPEEKAHGCKELNSSRVSLVAGEVDASVIFQNANSSDEGIYEVEVINKNTSSKRVFNVTITEQLASNFHPRPPFIPSSPAPDLPKDATTTAVNQGVTIMAIVGPVVLILVLTIVFFYFIYLRCKKDEINHNRGKADSSLLKKWSRYIYKGIKVVDDNRLERDLNHGC